MTRMIIYINESGVSVTTSTPDLQVTVVHSQEEDSEVYVLSADSMDLKSPEAIEEQHQHWIHGNDTDETDDTDKKSTGSEWVAPEPDPSRTAFHFDVQQVQVDIVGQLRKHLYCAVSHAVLAETLRYDLKEEGCRELFETAIGGLIEQQLVDNIPTEGYRLIVACLPEVELLVKARRVEAECPKCQCTPSWPCHITCPGGEACTCHNRGAA